MINKNFIVLFTIFMFLSFALAHYEYLQDDSNYEEYPINTCDKTVIGLINCLETNTFEQLIATLRALNSSGNNVTLAEIINAFLTSVESLSSIINSNCLQKFICT